MHGTQKVLMWVDSGGFTTTTIDSKWSSTRNAGIFKVINQLLHRRNPFKTTRTPSNRPESVWPSETENIVYLVLTPSSVSPSLVSLSLAAFLITGFDNLWLEVTILAAPWDKSRQLMRLFPSCCPKLPLVLGDNPVINSKAIFSPVCQSKIAEYS